MKSKENKIKIYTGLLITVICIIGISYAWFRLYLRQSENNKIASRNCFSTSLTEDSAKIDLVDAVSMYDEQGLEETPFTFTIKNNCSGYVKAYITIDSQYRDSSSSSYLKDDFVKVNLSPKGTTNSPSVILTDKNLIDLDNNRKGYLIVDAGLNSNEERSFDLRIWIDSETTTSDGLNKTWLGKIVVVTQASNFASPDGWNGAKDGTLLAAIKRDNNVGEPLTTPGAEVSSSTEAVLASTEDDYGTSYYFRGAVTNNFVEYANMCWRIVRVTGDGSIKLVLYNYNGLTSTNNTPSSSTPFNVTGDDYALARYKGDTYRSAFNLSDNDNAYVGFMYGTASASSYSDAHANTNASTILTNLNKWYTNVLSKQANFKDSQLADTIWCNDKSVVTDTTFNPNNFTLGTNYGYGTNKNYYSATKRLVQASSKMAGGTGPSLICPNDNNGGKLSKFTVSDTKYGNGNLDKKIGLLTVDELALAGYASGFPNSTTYLQKNADFYWWSLSPYGFYGGGAFVWEVNGSHGRFDGNTGFNTGGVRPSISLKSTTNVTGDGTSSSPYKIVS
ncbi:MAG: hypothetical protein MST00_06185 [Tenericutes bacterium]|nr:hypothetical protein [Mycoplasmatota bacterium]